MASLRRFTRGLRRLFMRRTADEELSDEIAQYLDAATAEYVRAGLPRGEAARRARMDFGGVESAKEAVRSAGWESFVEAASRDFGYAVRGLRRAPAFTAVALLTLALGVGANTAMFSVVEAVMLRPLPYRDPGRLALISTDDPRRGLHDEPTAYRTIQDWRDATHTFGEIAFFSTNRAALLTNGLAHGRTRNAFVSGNLFPLLGSRAFIGRAISPLDEDNAEPVAVVSYSLWQRELGGDSAAIGRTIQTDAAGDDVRLFRVIGVMPPAFYFPDKQTEIWIPATTYWRFRRESIERFPDLARRWTAVARLAPGATIDDARTDLARIGVRLAATYESDVPNFPGFGTNVVPLLDHVAGRDLQRALWLLLGAVCLVLFAACATVANLLLARGATRQRELAIRRALGAGRARIAAQLMVESLVLALTGGALGVGVAAVGVKVLGAVAASRIPRIDEISLDDRVLLFALGASLVAGVLFGVVPSLRLSAARDDVLKSGVRASGARELHRARGVLVAVECALAILLLAGAGLLLRSLGALRAVDPGFDPANVLSVRVDLPHEAPPTAEERTQTSALAVARAQARMARLDELASRLSSIDGVEAVGFIDDLFITGSGHHSITIPGRAADSFVAGELNDGSVSPGFFSAMHVPLRRGRLLSPDDEQTKIRAMWTGVVTDQSLAEKRAHAVAEPVVVNEAFARRFFPDANPIGEEFCIDPTNKTYWYRIVGVIGDMHRQGLERRAIPEYFGPFLPTPNGRVDVLIRTRRDPVALAPTVRAVVTAELPGSVVPSVSTAERQLGAFSAERDFQTWLLSTFAVLAMTLAGVGIYGVVHYAVAERTRELGVRMALGASPAEVMALVLRQGMLMPAAGTAAGIASAAVATRMMSHLLFGVGATDAVTFGGVLATLGAVALVACLVPARRAARIDPMVALRHE
ncbi:MAG TPA: ABC transporter permease [Gemmatimonadaceae bacterium]|nr:ABC transporter permease [Gemmatimonadaceae bacterium]